MPKFKHPIVVKAMNCINHPTDFAVSQCMYWGKGLCVECTNKFSKPFCQDCFSGFRKKQKRAIVMDILLTFLIGLPVGILLSSLFHAPTSPDYKYFLIYLGLGIVPGWKTLSWVTPQTFLFMSILGSWALYHFIKVILSLFVGLVSFPLMMIKNVLTLLKYG